MVKQPKDRNYVQKHLREFNKSAVHTDRKKESKRNNHGSDKHKPKYTEED